MKCFLKHFIKSNTIHK